jgi:hypothetical protein
MEHLISVDSQVRHTCCQLFKENLEFKARQSCADAQMHADLVVLGYDGSYNRVAAFVRA